VSAFLAEARSIPDGHVLDGSRRQIVNGTVAVLGADLQRRHRFFAYPNM